MIPNPAEPLAYETRGRIFEAFLERSGEMPEAVAISSCYGECSYQYLEIISGRIAKFLLKDPKVQEQRQVAIIADRNPALIYAMLGVLRAGATFLVVDSSYPIARILAMFSSWKPALIVDCCDGGLPTNLDWQGLPLIKIPADPISVMTAFPEESSGSLDVLGRVDDVAYVSFTSGTTGQPKGIATNHAPLVHFVDWHSKRHGLSSRDRFSLLSGLGHDPVLRDIFTPLSIGATLIIPLQSAIFDPLRLVAWLSDHEITVCHLTPALGEVVALGADIGSQKLHALKYLFWGGDVLSVKVSQRLRAVAPNALQVNFYGATETPQAMACFDVDPEWRGGPLPVGRAIDDAQLLVVTNTGDLAQIDELGEIWIRTPYLSLGYLEDPERTISRFVTNPFSNSRASDSRCYRTGDFGKYLPDGNVVFAGRMDHQVKIRGFRVELTDISSTMERFSEVSRGFVIAREGTNGQKILIAYFSSTDGKKVAVSELIEYLKAQLPSYMVPPMLIPIDRFPLLPNGKIDAHALPCPLDQPVVAGANQIEQNGALLDGHADGNFANKHEQKLLQIWQTVLGHSRITVNDSFVDVGGDSLSAIAVLVQMQRMGIEDSVARGIFQGWTIRQIAAGSNSGAEEVKSDSTKQRLLLNQVVNVVRGVLVAILVMDHWYDGLLNYLPVPFKATKEWLIPVFNIATPGFAVIFGLGLGYIYYPRFQKDAIKIAKTLAIGALFVFVGITVRAIAKLTVFLAEGGQLDSAEFINSFYGVLPYYALALLSAPLWFKLVGFGKNRYLRLAVLTLTSYLTYKLAIIFWLGAEEQGAVQFVRLMLVAKFNYFNMSVGALAGMAAGIFMASWAKEGRTLLNLTPHFLKTGMLLVSLGIWMAFANADGWETLNNSKDMSLHRWLFYSGVIAFIFMATSTFMARYDALSVHSRVALNVIAVLGQVSLPMFVFHSLVFDVKNLLEIAGVPKGPAIVIPLLGFLLFFWKLMSRLYRLYYSPAINYSTAYENRKY